jgi:O-6-methylguanine DNA methyltransferase
MANPQTGRGLLGALRALRKERAPATLIPTVLKRVGLADAYFELNSPIGPVFVAYNRAGISAVMREASREAFERAFFALKGRRTYPASPPPARLTHAIQRLLTGNARPKLRFDLSHISEFEQAVLKKALEVPRGEVRSYAWVAGEIGRPRAVRAVGSALARNPIPLLIPCHRIVRSDGHIGNYGLGGSDAKRAVLTAEGLEPDRLEFLARSGVRYLGSDTTRIYCLPSCRQARRIGTRHRVEFHTRGQAAAAGYRPCRLCRPVSMRAS